MSRVRSGLLRKTLIAAGAAATCSALLAAPGDPAGGEFQLNAANGVNNPAVAMAADGSFVAAWQGSAYQIYQQRYDAAGVALGSNALLGTTGFVSAPAVARADDGRYAIAWQGGNPADIFVQTFNADGTPHAAAVRANTTTDNAQTSPSIAMDADGDFLVAWTHFDGSSATDVFAQRFDADGVPQGSEFQVNAQTPGNQNNPSVAMKANGDFVVVYSSEGQDGDGFGVYGRRFTAGGAPLGTEFRVNTTTIGGQLGPSVARNADGAFVVTWLQFPAAIMGQRFEAAGAAVGSEFPVSVLASGSDPVVAMDDGGDFLVAWQAYGDDPLQFGTGIYARRFAADGTAGAEMRVNATTTGDQNVPAVAMDADGSAVVVWQGSQLHTNLDIFGQRFAGAVAAPDTTPDPFSFTDQANVATGSVVTSNAITVSGIDAAAAISVTGGEYRVNAGAFGTAAGTVVAGDSVQVRHTAAATAGTATNTTLTIGGVSDTFTSTTADGSGDTTPDAFELGERSDVEPGEQVESNVITVAGIDSAAPISVTGGEYRIGTGAYTSAPGTVANGQAVQVRVTAADFDQAASATLDIGGVRDTFTATSRNARHDTVMDIEGRPVTFDVSQGTLVNLQLVPVPAGAPRGYRFDFGFFAFEVEDLPVGGVVTVLITLPAGTPTPEVYMKCDPTCAFYDATLIVGNQVLITLVDGGSGDFDGVADGHVLDPGAPARLPPDKGGALDPLALGLLLLPAALRRRRR